MLVAMTLALEELQVIHMLEVQEMCNLVSVQAVVVVVPQQ
jgi:hypothetical protein